MRLTPSRRRTLWAYAFLAPSLLFFLVIVVAPIVYAFVMSLFDWTLGAAAHRYFVGLRNYADILREPLFLRSLSNTGRFVLLMVPVTLVLSLVLAIALNSASVVARGLYRTVYFVPVVISMVAAAFVWRWLLEPSAGPVNYVLSVFRIKGPGWLKDPNWAIPAVSIVGIWRDIGFYMVIFLSGLQTIPREFYEAAMVDGAGPWQRFWKITIPLLNPTIVLATVMAVISDLQIFTQVWVMTGGGSTVPGGPLHSTRTLVLHIYQAAFRTLAMGYASAGAFVLFAIIFVFTLIQLRILERPFEY
ncbi:MAG: sugar ABC transporter permease [Anaerolineae bacterium]|nr:sugar ABC transporter permease [Anaerolineae bacterium]